MWKGLSLLPEIPINGQRPRTTEYKRRKAGNIEQIKFVARRSELGPAVRHIQQLDRAEPVREMDSQHRYEENRGHGQAYKRDESPEQDRETAEEFGQNGEPSNEMGRGYADRMQNGGEDFRSPGKLRVAMRHETIANNQPQRKRSPNSYRRSCQRCQRVA